MEPDRFTVVFEKLAEETRLGEEYKISFEHSSQEGEEIRRLIEAVGEVNRGDFQLLTTTSPK
jgi:hypothetical protein